MLTWDPQLENSIKYIIADHFAGSPAAGYCVTCPISRLHGQVPKTDRSE